MIFKPMIKFLGLLLLPLSIFSQNLPTPDDFQQKRESLQKSKIQLKETASKLEELEKELKAAEAAGNADLVQKKKDELEAARTQRKTAYEDLKGGMTKNRREKDPEFRKARREFDPANDPIDTD
mgnify:CR=1 FL=1